MIWRHIIAKIFGFEVVWLVDFDGEVNCRLVTRRPYGLVGYRFSRLFNIGGLVCKPDGTVQGPSYVKRWFYA